MLKNKGNGHKTRTKTISFGSPGRFGHDSSEFYASRLYEGLTLAKQSDYVENPLPAERSRILFRICRGSLGDWGLVFTTYSGK